MITSKLVWLELLTKPLRDYAPKLARLFRAFLMIKNIIACYPFRIGTSRPASRPRFENA